LNCECTARPSHYFSSAFCMSWRPARVVCPRCLPAGPCRSILVPGLGTSDNWSEAFRWSCEVDR
jgi:hypothetical protein